MPFECFSRKWSWLPRRTACPEGLLALKECLPRSTACPEGRHTLSSKQSVCSVCRPLTRIRSMRSRMLCVVEFCRAPPPNIPQHPRGRLLESVRYIGGNSQYGDLDGRTTQNPQDLSPWSAERSEADTPSQPCPQGGQAIAWIHSCTHESPLATS